MEPRECPICLEDLAGTLEIATACCGQRIHTKCVNAMIDFYELARRDTPCPLCRTAIAQYTAIDIAPDQAAADQERVPEGSSDALVVCVTVTILVNTVIALAGLMLNH